MNKFCFKSTGLTQQEEKLIDQSQLHSKG